MKIRQGDPELKADIDRKRPGYGRKYVLRIDFLGHRGGFSPGDDPEYFEFSKDLDMVDSTDKPYEERRTPTQRQDVTKDLVKDAIKIWREKVNNPEDKAPITVTEIKRIYVEEKQTLLRGEEIQYGEQGEEGEE